MVRKNQLDKIFLFIAVIIIFYISLILLSDFNKINQSNLIFKIEYIPIAIFLIGLHTIISGLRYHRLLHKIDIRISFFESFKIFVAGLSLGITPAGIGSAIKSHILKNKFGKNISHTLPVVFLERWTELLGILIILSVLTIWINNYEFSIILIIGYILTGIMYILFSSSSVFNSIKKILTKIKYLKKFSSSITESKDSFNTLTSTKTLVEAVAYSILAKSIHLVTVFLIFLSVGLDLGFLQSGQIYYNSLLIGALSFIPAGIVVTETSMIAFLMDNKVEFSIATLSVILIRFVSTWLLTISGTVMYYFKFRNTEDIGNNSKDDKI